MNRKLARWMIFVSYILLVALNQLLWINFVAISDVVSSMYGVNDFYVGLLAIVFPVVYVFISIPVGMFIDTRGYKMSLLAGATLMTAFTIVRMVQPSYAVLMIGQTGIALAQPFLNNSISRLANTEFEKKNVPLVIGIGSLAIFLGVGAGLILPSLMVQYMGFWWMMNAITVASIIIFLLFIFSLFLAGLGENVVKEERQGFRHMLTLKDLLVFSMVTFVGMGVFNGFLTWIQQILAHLRITDVEIGMDGLIFVIGGMVGSIVIPSMVVIYGKRKFFVLLAFAISVPVLMLIPFINNFIAMLAITAILGFFMLGSFPVLVDWGTVVAGTSLAGSATSFLWFMGQIGGFIIPLIMGGVGPLSPDSTYLYAMVISAVLFATLIPFVMRVREAQKIISPGSDSQ